jgi:hypothetical protein
MSSTAEELSAQAEHLQSAVEFFKVDGNETRRRAVVKIRPVRQEVFTNYS